MLCNLGLLPLLFVLYYTTGVSHIMWGDELLGLRSLRAFLVSIVFSSFINVTYQSMFLKTLCSLSLRVFLMKQSAVKSKPFVLFLTWT